MPDLRGGGAPESSSIEGLASETSSLGWEAIEEPLELDPVEGEIQPEAVVVPRRPMADRPIDDIEPLEITDPESLPDSEVEDGEPGASPESPDEPAARGWWQEHADRWTDPAHQREIELTPHERRPSPFRREVAERIPDWARKERRRPARWTWEAK